MEDILVVVISAIVSGAVAAFLYGVFRDYAMNRRVTAIENHLDSLSGSIRGAKGNAAMAAAKEEEQAAIAEGAALLASGGLTKEAITGLIAKYPNAAKGLLKRFGM